MKQTKVITLLLVAIAAGILGAVYGIMLVNHGYAIPIAKQTTLVTMPTIGVLLFLVALPVIRYRRALGEYTKAMAEGRAGMQQRPKPLDPFYAVRVLLLAKSIAFASAVFAGFQAGIVLLQLASPVLTSAIWLNLAAVIGAIFSLIVGLLIERFCKVPGDSTGGSAPTDGAAA